MPHVIVKIKAGKTEDEKAAIAAAMTAGLMSSVDSAEATISVSIEDIPADDWVEKVYRPDILAKMDRLYKKPGYDPLEVGM